MPAYLAEFYRDGDTEPYHRWAPFGSVDDHAAEIAIRRNITRNTEKGGTLAACRRFTFREATPGAPIIDRTVWP